MPGQGRAPRCNGSRGVPGWRQELGPWSLRDPKEPSGACPSRGAAGACFLLSPGNCMEHCISGSVLSSPPAFPALITGSCRLCPFTCSPSVLPAPLGLLPKQTQRGHTAFLPHCACSCFFCCSFGICPRLLPHCGGRATSPGEWQSPMVPKPGTPRGPCPSPCLVLELGTGSAAWHGQERGMCRVEEDRPAG